MRKTVLQAVAFSISVHVLIIGFEMIRGYWLTKSYQPSITNAYEEVYILQDEVAFGLIDRPEGLPLEWISFIGLILLFMISKTLWNKLKTT